MAYISTTVAPSYGTVNPNNGGYFFNVLQNKWYDPSGVVVDKGLNFLDAIVYADTTGNATYIESIGKIEYKDIVKANKFVSKNSCTAWALVDATTTPPSLIDSYNVSSVIRTATGNYDVYTQMDNNLYSVVGLADNGDAGASNLVIHTDYTKPKTSNKFSLVSELSTGTNQNCIFSILLFGGKN